MREEPIELSQKERDRLKVLHEVQQSHLKQVGASLQLGLSTRQVRRILRRLKQEGDRGLIHRSRGRDSNRKIPAAQQERIISEVRRRYADFGPTLAAEKLIAQGLVVSRETLRQWMSQAGVWKPRRQRLKAVHVWRQRRAAFGELVMMDSSPFRWLEERGPQLHLIALIDDATSRITARFVEHDTTEENLRTLQIWLRRYGRPLALYTDKGSIFRAVKPPELEEQLAGQLAHTQFGRALQELDIRWIAAHSPQAKGRIERLFATLQDRLVKELRLAGIATVAAANCLLDEVFLPFWEKRFTVAPRQARDAHRSLGREHRLEQILSIRERRSVASDYTVRWRGQVWAIPRAEVQPGLRGAPIQVEQRLDGSVWARFRQAYLTLRPCPTPRRFSTTPFGLRPPGVVENREGEDKNQNKTPNKRKYLPPPDHPWRRTFLNCQKPDISILR
jgi:Homeodomain-like domain